MGPGGDRPVPVVACPTHLGCPVLGPFPGHTHPPPAPPTHAGPVQAPPTPSQAAGPPPAGPRPLQLSITRQLEPEPTRGHPGEAAGLQPGQPHPRAAGAGSLSSSTPPQADLHPLGPQAPPAATHQDPPDAAPHAHKQLLALGHVEQPTLGHLRHRIQHGLVRGPDADLRAHSRAGWASEGRTGGSSGPCSPLEPPDAPLTPTGEAPSAACPSRAGLEAHSTATASPPKGRE